MASRSIHFSRLLDIISGSALAAANTIVQKSALKKDFDIAKLESKRLRELIDANLPTFYVLKLGMVAEEVANNLSDKYFTENTDYISSKNITNTTLKEQLLKELTNKFASNVLPSKSFLSVYSSLDKLYKELLNKLSSRKSYVGYRNAASTFGLSMRKLLKSEGVFIANDANNIVSGLGDGDIVVIGPTFEATRKKVNEILNSSISSFFKKQYDLTTKKYTSATDTGFQIGDLINLGHTAAYKESGSAIGINMPATQEKQFVLSGTGKEAGLESNIVDLYLESKSEIVFKQNFVTQANNLLDMQFSFTISMPRDFNTNTLRVEELKRINTYLKGTVLPTVIEQAKKKFFGGMVTDTSASPNLIQFISANTAAIIEGKKVTPIVKTNKATKISKDIQISAIIGDNIPKVSGKTRTGSLRVTYANPVKKVLSSIVNLEAILRAGINEQVRKNMGTGSETRILNYRTGRFSESVGIERISESRQGMISVFYNYMKYPYATFSAGGRQQNPKTRDPKLLISKSIRELAAPIVGNRLRSVLV